MVMLIFTMMLIMIKLGDGEGNDDNDDENNDVGDARNDDGKEDNNGGNYGHYIDCCAQVTILVEQWQ